MLNCYCILFIKYIVTLPNVFSVFKSVDLVSETSIVVSILYDLISLYLIRDAESVGIQHLNFPRCNQNIKKVWNIIRLFCKGTVVDTGRECGYRRTLLR